MKCNYCEKDNLVALKNGYNVEVGFFLCMDCHSKYKKGNEEINKKFNEFLETRPDLKLKYYKKKDIKIPKCPTCGSTNIERISGSSKVGAAVLFGLFSLGHLSKTFKCKSCGYKW